ncbi:hypothetical protein [Gordoniibacillus kamchatkensis]|uniref:hypothetical protein n=1 Tax=Gordoniibacillus kamchatkensis TaxID=1590651 RepID=UPI000AB4D716|nr:hypothetical protein [Paenibacillus sp. VKM B-2647]
MDVIEEEKKDNIPKQEFIKTEDAIAAHKPLPSYKPTEDYSIERAQDLLLNGLKVQGSDIIPLKILLLI